MQVRRQLLTIAESVGSPPLTISRRVVCDGHCGLIIDAEAII